MTRFLLLPVLLVLAGAPLRAATPEAEVRAADTARVLATLQGDVDRLAPLLSDGLTYGHVDGRVQTKAEFLAAVRTNRIKYEAYDYLETHVDPVSAGVAVMTGRAHLKASAGATRVEFTLRFLSIWRREGVAWRLFAYQSVRVAEPPGTR